MDDMRNTALPRRSAGIWTGTSVLPDHLADICAFFLIIMNAGWLSWQAAASWSGAMGFEAEWIAHSIVAGYGFSFDGTHRWLFESAPANIYGVSAWTEPVYTYLLAGAFALLGEGARFPLVLLNVIFVTVSLALVYAAAIRSMGRAVGLASVAVLVMNVSFGRNAVASLSNAALGAMLAAACMLAFVLLCERPTWRRAIALGAVIGLTALACPATLLFLPVVAVLVILEVGSGQARRAGLATITCVVAVAVISPWTLRNQLVLGEFIPVRTGLGQISHLGTVVLDQFAIDGIPQVAGDGTLRADGHRAAVALATRPDVLRALERHQLSILMNLVSPETLARMNEAERDKLLYQKAKAFVIERPKEAAVLAIGKLHTYATILGREAGMVILVLAVGGAIWGSRRRYVRSFGLLLAAYVAPFLIIVPYYNRYRIPGEPLAAVLAAYSLVFVASAIFRSLFRNGRPSGSRSRPKVDDQANPIALG